MERQRQLELIGQNMERRELCKVVQKSVWGYPEAFAEHLAAQAWDVMTKNNRQTSHRAGRC